MYFSSNEICTNCMAWSLISWLVDCVGIAGCITTHASNVGIPWQTEDHVLTVSLSEATLPPPDADCTTTITSFCELGN